MNGSKSPAWIRNANRRALDRAATRAIPPLRGLRRVGRKRATRVCQGGSLKDQVEQREALRIEKAVSLDDLAARNRKPHHRERPPVGQDDHPGGAIDERRNGPRSNSGRAGSFRLPPPQESRRDADQCGCHHRPPGEPGVDRRDGADELHDAKDQDHPPEGACVHGVLGKRS
jgi:hypothetical protein